MRRDPDISSTDQTTRADVVDDVIAGYEVLMQRLADTHTPEFLEIAITMPQAKLLYLVGAAGDLRMSDLVTRLGVSLSTISGLVDRLVDHGLATRREDTADRRHVVVGLTPAGRDFIDRFRELNARQMRQLLELLDDRGLRDVRGALGALSAAAEQLAAGQAAAPPPQTPSAPRPVTHPATTPRKEPA